MSTRSGERVVSKPRRRYLTKSQAGVLKAMADNDGQAIIATGTRWSRFSPGRVALFGQAFDSLLSNRFITSKGQNELGSFVWTAEGREAHQRGWYIPVIRKAHWLDEKPEPSRGNGETP